jgi:hypothetical protein
VTVTLGIRRSDPLAWLIGLFTAKTTRRYVRIEAEGLKRRCEADVQVSATGS